MKKATQYLLVVAGASLVFAGWDTRACAQSAVPTVNASEPVATSDLLNLVMGAIRNNDVRVLPDYVPLLVPIVASEPATATGLRARNLLVESQLRLGQLDAARDLTAEALQLPVVLDDGSLKQVWLYLDAEIAVRDAAAEPDAAAKANAAIAKLTTYIQHVRPAQAGGPLRASASAAALANAHLRRVELTQQFGTPAEALATANEALADITQTLIPAGLAPADLLHAGRTRLAGALIADGQIDNAVAIILAIATPRQQGIAALTAAESARQHVGNRAQFAASYVREAPATVPAEQLMSLVALTVADWTDTDTLALAPALLGPDFAARMTEYETMVVARRPAVDRALRSTEMHPLRLGVLGRLWRAQMNTGDVAAASTRATLLAEFDDDLATVRQFGVAVD